MSGSKTVFYIRASALDTENVGDLLTEGRINIDALPGLAEYKRDKEEANDAKEYDIWLSSNWESPGYEEPAESDF